MKLDTVTDSNASNDLRMSGGFGPSNNFGAVLLPDETVISTELFQRLKGRSCSVWKMTWREYFTMLLDGEVFHIVKS